jgi:hypothetical protein
MTGFGVRRPERTGLGPQSPAQNARISGGPASLTEKTGQVLVRTPMDKKVKHFKGGSELCQEF